ncbi:MAG: hypothetical protein OSJ73_21885 [Lachnospiraceae bacterium]|nr:hypothetical protein [Lachnospiraceae bacterium]
MIALLKILTMALYSILPSSPFREAVNAVKDFNFLPYLNWFIPFDSCTKFTALWCISLMTYYNFAFIKKIIDKIKDTIF